MPSTNLIDNRIRLAVAIRAALEYQKDLTSELEVIEDYKQEGIAYSFPRRKIAGDARRFLREQLEKVEALLNGLGSVREFQTPDGCSDLFDEVMTTLDSNAPDHEVMEEYIQLVADKIGRRILAEEIEKGESSA